MKHLFVLIIIFKYCDRRQTDVGPTSAGDINPTSKRRWADIAQPISTQRRPNTCSLVVFFHSIICQNYFVFAPKSSQCWKQRSILVQSWHCYRPTAQQAHDAIITSFWRHNDVIFASCVCWVYTNMKTWFILTHWGPDKISNAFFECKYMNFD